MLLETRLAGLFRSVDCDETLNGRPLLRFEQITTHHYPNGYPADQLDAVIAPIRDLLWTTVATTSLYRRYYVYMAPIADHPFVLSDARSLVLTQARKLNASYRRFESSGNAPMERLKFIASLQGLTLAPMNIERSRHERRDAVVILNGADKGKRGQILYNPDRPSGRRAFSIAHEIAHTFFPSTSGGGRFKVEVQLPS